VFTVASFDGLVAPATTANMGTSMLQDSYEVRDFHRSLLQRNRPYLLHNIRPCEMLWSSLLAKEVLSYHMVDEIKVVATVCL
jgi:hypothetical protein